MTPRDILFLIACFVVCAGRADRSGAQTPAAPSTFETPSWVKGAVFYQIFPDRFFNGDPANDTNAYYAVTKRPAGRKWNIGDRYLEDWDTGKPSHNNSFGGDLKGVIEKLDYIKSLGVTAIYLNPIFRSPSNHKYDIVDYLAVDPQFGSNEQFKELVAKAHALGLKVVLDGVFNHTADESPFFEDAARNGPRSKYYSWYHIRKWPFPGGYPPRWGTKTNAPPEYYDCWSGFGHMPKLNYASAEVRRFILKVGTFWIGEMGADGWRLDVANEVPHDFWKEFRAAIKAVKPDAYLVGEIWGDGRNWLKGDEFDAVMNYRFRGLVTDFFAGSRIPPSKFAEGISHLTLDHPEQVNQAQFNLLGSHDTMRFMNTCWSNPNKFKLAVAFQMLYPGAPAIYYGDEIGMAGGNDPDNRRPFVWTESGWNTNILNHCKRMIAMRKANAVFGTGSIKPILSDDANQVVVFAHTNRTEHAVSVFNRSTAQRTIAIDLKSAGLHAGKALDLLSGEVLPVENGSIALTVEPCSFRVLRLE